jgi:AbrB family looped-hinge helix DNA binding protein
MIATMSSKGQIVIPSEFRRADRIASGQQFEIERETEGTYRLRRLSHPNDGFVDWLVSCPDPDFLDGLGCGERTSDLEPPVV